MVKLRLSVVLCWLFFSALQAQASEPCLDRVFGQYCLGGDIGLLSEIRPEYLHRQQEGNRLALIYEDGNQRDYVMAYRGRIYKVLRQYRPASSSRYRHLRGELRALYGMPRELSRFPWYARQLSAKIDAIQRGEGMALLRWEPVRSPWRLELSWTREIGLSLAYIADTGERVEAERVDPPLLRTIH